MIAIAGMVAIAWVGSALFWCTLSCVVKRGLPGDYNVFCEMWGLCFFWPITLTCELIVWLGDRKHARSRREA